MLQVFLFSIALFATEPTTLTIKGMHCGGCVAAVKKMVCDKNTFAKCEVSIKDAEKELGQLVITPADKTPLDLKKIGEQITKAGYELQP